MPVDAEPSASGNALSPSDRALRAVTGSLSDVVTRPATGHRFDSRTRLLREGPIVGTLLRLATPNVLVLFVQASVGLIETYFVAKLGTDALAGVALVFPVPMLMQMMSAGAMGGGRLALRWSGNLFHAFLAPSAGLAVLGLINAGAAARGARFGRVGWPRSPGGRDR